MKKQEIYIATEQRDYEYEHYATAFPFSTKEKAMEFGRKELENFKECVTSLSDGLETREGDSCIEAWLNNGYAEFSFNVELKTIDEEVNEFEEF